MCKKTISICSRVCKMSWQMFLLTQELFAFISQHLQELAISLGQYFPHNADPRKGNFWIIDLCNLNTVEKELLMELSCDTTLMSKHKDLPLSQFWLSLTTECPELSDKAIKLLLIFSTTFTYVRKAFHFYLSSRPNREILRKLTLYFVFQKLHYNHVYHF